jgi:hypothetical protein
VVRGKAENVRIGVLAAGLVLLASGCGFGAGSSGKEGDSLQVTREDGSQVKLPDEVHAWCGPGLFAKNSDTPNRRELWVVGGELPPEEEGVEPEAFWLFSWPTEGIERSPRLELPSETEAPGGHAAFFVYDSETPNELSSAEEAAKGTIEVEKWSCEKDDTVRITVDAKLYGELFQAPSATVKGEIEAVIGDPLPIPD